MYCRSCGKELENGANFCRYCGAETGLKNTKPSAVAAQEKTVNDHAAYVLSALAGYVSFLVASFIIMRMAASFGTYCLLAANVVETYLAASILIPLITGIVYAIAIKQKNRLKQEKTLTVLALSLQGLLILSAFLIPAHLCRLLVTEPEGTSLAIDLFRTFAITALIISAVSVIAGVAINKSLVSVLISSAVGFGACLIVLCLGIYVFHFGLITVAFAFGVIQPVVMLLPNVGHWR